MASIPPWPQEFLIRVIADTADAVRFDETPVREQVAAGLGRKHMGIITAEERARAALGERWDELAPAFVAALAEVEAEYAQHVDRLAWMRTELDVLGADSWIAGAVCARLAFDIGFDALGDVGGLAEL
jgi:hypothetical protein